MEEEIKRVWRAAATSGIREDLCVLRTVLVLDCWIRPDFICKPFGWRCPLTCGLLNLQLLQPFSYEPGPWRSPTPGRWNSEEHTCSKGGKGNHFWNLSNSFHCFFFFIRCCWFKNLWTSRYFLLFQVWKQTYSIYSQQCLFTCIKTGLAKWLFFLCLFVRLRKQ